MASTAWHSEVSALERYEMIQKITSHNSSMAEAVDAEQKAFREGGSKAEYERACEAAACATPEVSQGNSEAADDASSPGVQIGAYQSCHLFADGVTSEVYRSGNIALKVIVNHHNLEPHNPQREVKILQRLKPPCIPLHEVFRDQEQRLVLAFTYMPHTLASILESGPLSHDQIRNVFQDIFRALQHIHSQGIIHRDVKPSAILLQTPNGPAYLSDFGTAWASDLSSQSEPPDNKILDIGTGPYRAPEVLFGYREYGPPVDMWAAGVMLAEAATEPPIPIFESRAVHEDGNQLGLILSIFKTLGTPNEEVWPEAAGFKVNPFELWTIFPQRPWHKILPGVDSGVRDLVAKLIRFDGQRLTAEKALQSLPTITQTSDSPAR